MLHQIQGPCVPLILRSFRAFAGAHLMEISRLEGLTTQLYAEAHRDDGDVY